MKELKQGTKIKFDVQTIIGTGKIVGVAVVELPVIGRGYIVEPDNKISSDAYKYSHLVVYESQLEVITEQENENILYSIETSSKTEDIEYGDDRQYKCIQISDDIDADNGIYIKICSWDETRNHIDFNNIIDKKIKLIIKELD